MTFSSGEKKDGEGGQLNVERRAFLAMLPIQDPGSVRAPWTRKGLQEGHHRQVSVQICPEVASMDSERKKTVFFPRLYHGSLPPRSEASPTKPKVQVCNEQCRF